MLCMLSKTRSLSAALAVEDRDPFKRLIQTGDCLNLSQRRRPARNLFPGPCRDSCRRSIQHVWITSPALAHVSGAVAQTSPAPPKLNSLPAASETKATDPPFHQFCTLTACLTLSQVPLR